MKLSWFQLIKAVPQVKDAANCLEEKDWYKSQTILYNLIKTGVTVTAACGIVFGMSNEEMQTISTALAVAIPAILTIVDGVANIWLRFRTSQPLKTNTKLVGDKQD
jgi:hypothetical protein